MKKLIIFFLIASIHNVFGAAGSALAIEKADETIVETSASVSPSAEFKTPKKVTWAPDVVDRSDDYDATTREYRPAASGGASSVLRPTRSAVYTDINNALVRLSLSICLGDVVKFRDQLTTFGLTPEQLSKPFFSGSISLADRLINVACRNLATPHADKALEILQVLLDAGISINTTSADDADDRVHIRTDSPLYLVCVMRISDELFDQTVDILIRAGAQPDSSIRTMPLYAYSKRERMLSKYREHHGMPHIPPIRSLRDSYGSDSSDSDESYSERSERIAAERRSNMPGSGSGCCIIS